MEEIVKIEAINGKLIAHVRKELPGFRKPDENQIENSGGFLAQFDKILPTWYGYGIGIKDGKFYRIDLREHVIQTELSIETVKTDLYCKFVSAEEYSGVPHGLKFEMKEV